MAAAPTPTPTPDPAIWRVHGLVVDEQGRPIPDVCVAIGPHGCLQYSPRTNANGIFFFDAPQIPTVSYDLHYFTSEYQLLTMRVTPTGPTTFRVTLRKR
ncbi:MAG TPA: carboxypeptidase-like regulatory domain-containing protein [Solirubrobacteraceae bacterium]|nr:carboxypeptidase-like regulatory domain-containing protein [Solirubrobacteraceae bacterium]